MKRQILVISEDPSICTEIQKHMHDSFTDVCCMASNVAALADYMEQNYCLVIFDILCFGMERTELLRVMSRTKHTPILVLSEPLNTENKLALYHAGADACIERPVDMDICVAQANVLIQLYTDASANHDFQTPVIHDKEIFIIPCCRQVIIDGKTLELTRKEFDLLYHLAKSPGQIFTREELYDLIWNDGPVAVDEVVKSQIKRLRKKLASVGKNYIQNEWGVGYKFVLID